MFFFRLPQRFSYVCPAIYYNNVSTQVPGSCFDMNGMGNEIPIIVYQLRLVVEAIIISTFTNN